MAKNKLSILQEELRDRLNLLKEDIDDIQSGDEYDPTIYNETQLEIKFLNKTLNRIWELKHD
ncbi:hypothetical protein M3603_15305 [Rummeliibacillus stabekisii]|uniref:hypothetical protein n=1 Tax=Rummeliibacillus stabekisii TaxID=241244 RepID=UPI0020410325|nr:hypothetical protein [Rummeliibacillus stabekisii]MCM3317985.1 hypothetical protein [Rummeliibacillus stabekisii]